jgi:hypothetical protein
MVVIGHKASHTHSQQRQLVLFYEVSHSVLQILSLKKSKSRGRAASNVRRSDGETADDRLVPGMGYGSVIGYIRKCCTWNYPWPRIMHNNKVVGRDRSRNIGYCWTSSNTVNICVPTSYIGDWINIESE